jgi:cytochrome b involved in lipid metabolism
MSKETPSPDKTSSPVDTSKTYTYDDLKLHIKETSAWVAVFDKVYDVTEFALKHPGGKQVLLELAGTNATDEFEEQGHDDFHIEKMEEFLIGNYDDSKDPEGMR